MCGKYSLKPPQSLLETIPSEMQNQFARGETITPDMNVLIYKESGFACGKWGFLPDWAKPDFKAQTYNARSETVHEKAVFRSSWEKSQRCLFLASGFYEWPPRTGNKTQDQSRVGIEVKPDNVDLLFMAGLWEENKNGLRSTILTKPAGTKLAKTHPRMPVMLSRDQLPLWLKGGHQDALMLIQKASDQDIITEVLPQSSASKDTSTQQAMF